MIHQLVAEDIMDRERVGIETYGEPLVPFKSKKGSGSTRLEDAYHEVLDQSVYIKLYMEEQKQIHELCMNALAVVGRSTLMSSNGAEFKKALEDLQAVARWLGGD